VGLNGALEPHARPVAHRLLPTLQSFLHLFVRSIVLLVRHGRVSRLLTVAEWENIQLCLVEVGVHTAWVIHRYTVGLAHVALVLGLVRCFKQFLRGFVVLVRIRLAVLVHVLS